MYQVKQGRGVTGKSGFSVLGKARLGCTRNNKVGVYYVK